MRGTYDLEHCPSLALVGFRVSGRAVVMDLDSWESLRSALPLAVWTVGTHRGQALPVLRCPVHGRFMAARAIAGATDQQEVGYRDGGPFNLTRCNLVLSPSLRKVRRRVPVPMVGPPTTTPTA